MAIAHDATSTSTISDTANPVNWNHTCSGANRYLTVNVFLNKTGVTATGCTYNGVAMTLIDKYEPTPWAANYHNYLFGLVNPASGTHQISLTQSAGSDGTIAIGESYTGVDQSSSTPSASGKNTVTGGTSLTASATITVTGSVLVGCWVGLGDPVTAGAATEIVTDPSSHNPFTLQSASLTPPGTGSKSLVGTISSSSATFIIAALAPFAGTDYTSTLTETMTLVGSVLKGPGKTATATFTLTDTITRGISRAFSEVLTLTGTLSVTKIIPLILVETLSLTATILINGTDVIWAHITRSANAVWTKINRH